LQESGFISLPGPFATAREAFAVAKAALDKSKPRTDSSLEVVGEFVIPPADGPPSRDFQTLHIDFGLPLAPAAARDVALYTALHIPAGRPRSKAFTRLVSLQALLAGRSWPDAHELVRRFAGYGASHGAFADVEGYSEGSLARIIEAALGSEPVLPSVKADPGFLCGTEFPTLASELAFFKARHLDVLGAQTEVELRPGELLMFDNLAFAHGRRGRRQPGELHQCVFGYRALSVDRQVALRDRVLTSFNS
jgi:hypothetical protein